MMVDSHAHLDDKAFASDLPAVMERAREAGVERIVTIGTDLESSRRARAIAEFQCEAMGRRSLALYAATLSAGQQPVSPSGISI